MLDDRAKQEDNNIEDKTEVRKLTECIEKEMKPGKACYCINCDSEVESKENFSNHMYEAHVSPTTTCGNCHTTFKDILYLESHKKGCNGCVLRCEMSTSYEVKEKDPKEHLKEKHEELYPKESVGPKNQKQRNSFRTENCTNVNLFKCDGCEYTFKRTNEPEDHYQDYHCEEYNLNLSYRIGLKSVVKQVSSSNDIKKNNVAFSTDVPATMYSHDFACENCNNSMADKTHPKELMEYYHKARMKNTEGKPTWLRCGNQCDEKTDLRCHITIILKEGDKSSVFMGIRLTMIYCVIETEKLGPSWAKLNRN